MESFNTTMNTTTTSGLVVVFVKEDTVKLFNPSEALVSNEVRAATEVIVDLCISFIIANVGIVSNIIVILVFAKQGYTESMNVSMTAIAIWDLLKCLSGSTQRMAGPISLFSDADAESWNNIMTVVMTYFICFATYVSSVLAAYVAVERCLCVCLPFTVKTLLTPKVTFIAMVSLSVIVFGAFSVVFAIYDIIWVYSPKWNKTIAIYSYSQFFDAHHGPLMRYYNLSGVIWPTASFIVIVVCTVIIVYQLQKASKFRSDSQSTVTATPSLSTRDKQVVKMLLVIIAIYITNLSPRITLYMSKFFVYDLYFMRKYHNIFIVVVCWLFVLDFVNATVNLYIFLAMSSNFRETAKELFGFKSKSKK